MYHRSKQQGNNTTGTRKGRTTEQNGNVECNSSAGVTNGVGNHKISNEQRNAMWHRQNNKEQGNKARQGTTPVEQNGVVGKCTCT